MWMACLFFSILFAQTIQVSDSRRISLKYNDGEYLTYDCADKHWTCVDKESFQKCQGSCIRFKSFKKQKSCEQKQMQLIHQAGFASFCWKKDFRRKITRY